MIALAIFAVGCKQTNITGDVAYNVEASGISKELGDKYAHTIADGQYLVLLVTAQNLGENTEFYPFFELESNGKIFNRQIIVEPLKRHDLQPFFGGPLAKGESKLGHIVFDIPEDLDSINLVVKEKENSEEEVIIKVK